MKCDYTGFGTWCISTPEVSVWVQINCSPEELDSLTAVCSAFMDIGDRNVFLESWDSSISTMQNNTGWSLADCCSYSAGFFFFFFLQAKQQGKPRIIIYQILLHPLKRCTNIWSHFIVYYPTGFAIISIIIPYHEVHSGYFLAELRYKRLLLKHLLTAQRVQNWVISKGKIR